MRSTRNLLNLLKMIKNTNTSIKLLQPLVLQLFHQVWGIFTRTQQQSLALSIIKSLKTMSDIINTEHLVERDMRTLPNSILEFMMSLRPLLAFTPELLQYVGKYNNAWIPSILILEQQRLMFPDNPSATERYYFSLVELYWKIQQDDYLVGLRRDYVRTKTVKNALALSQHRMWEEANHQLNLAI